MKNDSHPLLQALKRRPPMPEVDPGGQTLVVDRDEAGDVREGQSISVQVYGTVKSIWSDGSVTLAVDRVESGKSPIITTQQSHAV